MSTDYLNRGFISRAWTYVTDLLSNEIIHGAWEDADKEDWHLHVSQTSLNMTALPKFTMSGSHLSFRLPGTGSYKFITYVEKHLDLLPDFGTSLAVSLSAEMTIGTDAPKIDVNVNIPTTWVGDLADWLLGFKGDLKERIKSGFEKHLGFFRTVRYDPSIPLAVPNPELVYGFAELDPNKAIDIVLVSDGFMTANMNDFRAVVDAFRTKLTTYASSRVNEPYFSFDTVIRIWKIEVPSSVPSDPRHRVVAQYLDVPSGSTKTALANLARMDAIGLKAETIGADVIVFMSNQEVLGGESRAMAMGGVVMLPVLASAAASDASVLVHELGHTVLGGLADEYVEKPTTLYHGKEPNAPNVTAEKPKPNGTAPAKWADWALNPTKRPSWDMYPIRGFEGARYYGLGLWRPAQNCKMYASSQDVSFCAVCREALTGGIRKILGKDTFLIEYGYPTRSERRRVRVGPADSTGKMVYRIRVPETGTIQVQAKFLAGSLPKPWTVSSAFTGTGTMAVLGYEWTFTAQFGDVLKLTVSSDCPFVPWDTLPSYTIELHCDLPLRDISQAAPSVPTNLKVAQHAASVGKPVLTRLAASSLDPNADDIKFQFEITNETGAFTGVVDAQSDWRSWTQASPTVTGTAVDLRLGAGSYKFRVRAVDATDRSSAWSAKMDFIVPGPEDMEV